LFFIYIDSFSEKEGGWEFSVGKRTFTNGNSSKFFYSAEGEKLRGIKKGKATYGFVHEKGLLCANLFKKSNFVRKRGILCTKLLY
jgi:hypothetical protein